MDVTEAQRCRGKAGAQADSGAICQTTNAATGLHIAITLHVINRS